MFKHSKSTRLLQLSGLVLLASATSALHRAAETADKLVTRLIDRAFDGAMDSAVAASGAKSAFVGWISGHKKLLGDLAVEYLDAHPEKTYVTLDVLYAWAPTRLADLAEWEGLLHVVKLTRPCDCTECEGEGDEPMTPAYPTTANTGSGPYDL